MVGCALSITFPRGPAEPPVARPPPHSPPPLRPKDLIERRSLCSS
jgi:hypothetical protein